MRERLEARRQKIVVGSPAHLGFNSDFTRIKENLTEKISPEKIFS